MIAIISDVHSNLAALEAVLARMADAEAILCCGDIVGYGPKPNECCELLRERGVLSVKGNHDRACATLVGLDGFTRRAAKAARWTHVQLSRENREWLCSLPLSRQYGGVSVVHGCPGSESNMLGTYVRRDWLNRSVCRQLTARVPGRYLLLGHTHVPMRCGKVLNPGSVGVPRDGDWRPSYLTIGSRKGRSGPGHELATQLGLHDTEVVLHRVWYDRRVTLSHVDAATGRPARPASVGRAGRRSGAAGGKGVGPGPAGLPD